MKVQRIIDDGHGAPNLIDPLYRGIDQAEVGDVLSPQPGGRLWEETVEAVSISRRILDERYGPLTYTHTPVRRRR